MTSFSVLCLGSPSKNCPGQTINWPGRSGQQYRYWIYPMSTTFKPTAGNYIFAKEASHGRWAPIYIGETSDLSERFDDHHKIGCIRRHGATHIHVHQNGDGQVARRREEADLIARWSPPCNG